MPFEGTITSIHQMTPRVKQFVIEADREFEFDPGQHTTVQFERDEPGEDEDEQVVRPYTPTSTPAANTFTLAIKRYDDGTASVYMHDRDPGDIVTFGDLDGNLTLRNADEDVVFVSTGTGITPMMAMLKQYLETGTGEVQFFYGEKTQEDLMYRETLDQLVTEHDRLSVVYSLSEEDWVGPTGHVQTHLEDRLDGLERDFYVCGVPQMVVDTKDHLADLGVPDDRVFSEGWEEGEIEE
ncbi:ferredoxin--NADP reductase [Natrinema caseinilyticum]|uniref:ferredoxin--NADP reductase n=1 Tax=Natrinema caseinilyticum TaxID=2961570 RepID=UPI0020C22D12|nr:FAD-dependent oxidoreductase [Natrinema caseinilyticum]